MAIAAKETPVGVKVVYHKTLSSEASVLTRRISVPRPVTPKALYIYLHELAHVLLGHRKDRIPVHVAEYHATVWAHRKMKESDIAVPRSVRRGARDYVRRMTMFALEHGAKHVDLEVLKYAGGSPERLACYIAKRDHARK